MDMEQLDFFENGLREKMCPFLPNVLEFI